MSPKLPTVKPLWLFATLWSLRQYPTLAREWSWPRKFAAIRDAGFDGVMSPPIPALAERGALRYLAVGSVSTPAAVTALFSESQRLGASAVNVQIGQPLTTLATALRLARSIRAASHAFALPVAIETHRATFTERPEQVQALQKAYRKIFDEALPICIDYSHFALVRHLATEATWPTLQRQPFILAHARQLHLRPSNAHHAQLPVLNTRGRRTPEYLAWRDQFAAPLLQHLRSRRRNEPLIVVPEFGHRAPTYGLSTHGDTWRDTLVLARDLRTLWSTR